MKIMTLPCGDKVKLCEKGYKLIKDYSWSKAGKCYVARRVEGKRKPNGERTRPSIYMHRQLTGAVKGQEVDHINGDKLDNRLCNLRLCTSQQNKYNRKSSWGSSKFKGVTFNKRAKKWAANIKDNKYMFLGYFEKEEEAALAYNREAARLHGEFALLNEVGK